MDPLIRRGVVRSVPAAPLRQQPAPPPYSPQRAFPLTLLALPLLLFLLIPLLVILTQSSPAEFWANLARAEVSQALRLSLVTSLMTTLLTLLLGTPLAYLLARRRFRGRRVVDTLLDLPMVLPPAVAGIALLLTFGRRGTLGVYLAEWGITVAFTPIAVVLAQLFVAAPFYVKTASAGLNIVERDLEEAAALDGADRWATFRYITAPLVWPILFGGLVMSWARALGEFGATIIFAGNFPGRTQTMPLAIYIGFELDLSVALTLSLILLLLSFGALFVVRGVLQQRLEVR